MRLFLCLRVFVVNDSIHAALIAFDDVLRALDAHSWSKHRAEEIELS